MFQFTYQFLWAILEDTLLRSIGTEDDKHIWGHEEVKKLARSINTIEDFKKLSLRTWNIKRKTLDILED